MHPKIDISEDSFLRIADIACGNGAWMLDLARRYPNAVLEGFDITSAHFPNEGFLPENIKFHVWDAFADVPESFVGAFDVVHLRALFSLIKDNNVAPVLMNAKKMLKPGGYIQWDEADSSTQRCTLPVGLKSAEATQTLVTFFNVLNQAPQVNLKADWLHNLAATLEKSGLSVLAEDKITPNKSMHRVWCDNYLTVWEHCIVDMPEKPFPLPAGLGLPKEMDRKTFVELWQKAAEECQNGAWINADQIVVVAKAGEPLSRT